MKKLLLALTFFLVTSHPLFAIEGGYKEGLTLQSDDGHYSLKTNLFLQFQHQFLHVDGQGSTNSFQIRRGRICFGGNAFVQELTYRFEFEFVGGLTNNVSPANAVTGPNLRDGYVNYDLGNGFEIKLGQFKVPFNFEELVSDTQQQFADRSMTNDTFTFNRDLGLNLHGRVLDKKLEYNLFAANEGNNQNTFNKNNMMLLGSRVAYNLLGDHGYTTSDPENSSEPQLMVGAAENFNRVGAPTAADMSVISMTGDAAFRYHGISAFGAGYYSRNQSASTNTFGFSGQTGYFLFPEHLEVIGRFNTVLPTGGVTKGYEVGGGLASYFKGHRLKAILDYNVLINSPLVLDTNGAAAPAGVNNPGNIVTTGGAPGFVQGQNDHRVRTQLQVVF